MRHRGKNNPWRTDHDPERLNQAFEAGKRAHAEGKTADDNPYPARGKERRKWYEGFVAEANLVQHHNRMERP
jgi:ribosome modulation factor